MAAVGLHWQSAAKRCLELQYKIFAVFYFLLYVRLHDMCTQCTTACSSFLHYCQAKREQSSLLLHYSCQCLLSITATLTSANCATCYINSALSPVWVYSSKCPLKYMELSPCIYLPLNHKQRSLLKVLSVQFTGQLPFSWQTYGLNTT